MDYLPEIRTVYAAFSRHGRRYSVFAVAGREDDFLYYSDATQSLRSLIFGKDFAGRLPGLLGNDEHCIECGLGLSVEGGVAMEGGNIRAWHFTTVEANQILAALKKNLGADGEWIRMF